MSLPVKTTLEDVTAIVSYLKTKPTGVTVSEARGVVDPKILDGRKLRAYDDWLIVQQDGDKIRLTETGRRLARTPGDAGLFREIVGSIPTYRASMEWAFHQSFRELTVDELAANWHEHHKSAVGTDADGSIKAAVTCFFNLAHGAGLGNYVLGRKGQPTRLELDREALRVFVEGGPSAPPWAGTDKIPDDDDDLSDEQEHGGEDDEVVVSAKQTASLPDATVQGSVRVFISHGRNMEVVEQVKTILDLADIKWEVAVEEESAAIPVPDKVFGAMRSCNAGIICVSAEEDTTGTGNGDFHLNQNVLIEIGAAFVLYDKRVVLLWDKRIPVPSNLQGLYRCEFDGDELSWTAGTKLMKAIQGFKQ
jgi:hypothetical protein